MTDTRKFIDEISRLNRLLAERTTAARRLLRALDELTEEAHANMTGGAGHLIDNAHRATALARQEGITPMTDEEYE